MIDSQFANFWQTSNKLPGKVISSWKINKNFQLEFKLKVEKYRLKYFCMRCNSSRQESWSNFGLNFQFEIKFSSWNIFKLRMGFQVENTLKAWSMKGKGSWMHMSRIKTKAASREASSLVAQIFKSDLKILIFNLKSTWRFMKFWVEEKFEFKWTRLVNSSSFLQEIFNCNFFQFEKLFNLKFFSSWKYLQ